jgi:hypothetical protein
MRPPQLMPRTLVKRLYLREMYELRKMFFKDALSLCFRGSTLDVTSAINRTRGVRGSYHRCNMTQIASCRHHHTHTIVGAFVYCGPSAIWLEWRIWSLIICGRTFMVISLDSRQLQQCTRHLQLGSLHHVANYYVDSTGLFDFCGTTVGSPVLGRQFTLPSHSARSSTHLHRLLLQNPSQVIVRWYLTIWHMGSILRLPPSCVCGVGRLALLKWDLPGSIFSSRDYNQTANHNVRKLSIPCWLMTNKFRSDSRGRAYTIILSDCALLRLYHRYHKNLIGFSSVHLHLVPGMPTDWFAQPSLTIRHVTKAKMSKLLFCEHFHIALMLNPMSINERLQISIGPSCPPAKDACSWLLLPSWLIMGCLSVNLLGACAKLGVVCLDCGRYALWDWAIDLMIQTSINMFWQYGRPIILKMLWSTHCGWF